MHQYFPLVGTRATPALAVELWPADSAHVRLVATSCPVKVGVGDLGALIETLQEAKGELARVVMSLTGWGWSLIRTRSSEHKANTH